MMMHGVPSLNELAEYGVARISYGPIPYRMVIDALKESAQKALSPFS
jgi:2-methylisocitrate lyase-like PEP mutase family enzyme